ncbi:MAG: 16S rRNA pseudouridine(516) synthase, partial [Angelakisella sp.]
SDPRDKTVVDLVPPELWRKGLFPAGRLDKDTTGMVIITDDGDFAHRILAPKSHIAKTYLATLDIPVTAEMEAGFNAGISLKGEKQCMPAQLSVVDSHTARVVISEGMYHQIKRMFGCYGAKVLELRRISMGKLALDETLPEGSCRELTPEELLLLEK